MSDLKVKCDVSRKHVDPCSALSNSVEAVGHSRGKGIVVWETVNVETSKSARRMYGVKSGDFKKDGVVFNFCPFCGTDLTESHK